MNLFYLLFIEFMMKLQIPHFLIYILWIIINFIVIAVLMLLSVILLVLFERKFLAFFTRRKGPNRVGYNGCLQTVADAIKLLFKENITPKNSDKLIYFLAPLTVFAPIMFVWCLLPLSSEVTAIHSTCGILLFMAVLSIPIIGTLFAGYSSGNRYSFIGGIRACIQAISSELPIFIVIAGIIILSNSLDLNIIVQTQEGNLFNWNIFPSFLGFVIFFICSLIIMNRIPFDFPEAESELVAGYNSEYSGMKFAMFFLGEYALTFIFSAFTATLFLGGYNSPFGCYFADLLKLNIVPYEIIKNIEEFFWLILKTGLIIISIMWIRASYPRFKTDKTLEFCWHILIPCALFNLLLICIIQSTRGFL